MAAAPERDGELDLDRLYEYDKKIKQRTDAYHEQAVGSMSAPALLTAVAGALTLMGGIGLTGDPSETAYRVIFTEAEVASVAGLPDHDPDADTASQVSAEVQARKKALRRERRAVRRDGSGTGRRRFGRVRPVQDSRRVR